MALIPPINFKSWIDQHRHLLKPPVGNKMVYTDNKDFIVMIVGGPNARKDYHFEDGEELFYQIEGDITVKTIQDGKNVDVHIKEGEMFLLPGNTPHRPERPADTVGLVIECKRASITYEDGLIWFCDNCNNKLHEYRFHLDNIEKDFLPRTAPRAEWIKHDVRN